MITRVTSAIAGHASTPVFFVLNTVVCVAACITALVIHDHSAFMLVFTTGLSVAAWLFAILLLVAQRSGNAALHAKLDELIRVTEARNELIRAEERDEQEIEALREAPERTDGRNGSAGAAVSAGPLPRIET